MKKPAIFLILLFFTLVYARSQSMTSVTGIPPVYLLKADYYAANNSYGAALENYNKCLELDPHNVDALLKSAGLYQKFNQTDSAYVRYRDAFSIDKNKISDDHLWNYIKLLHKLEKYEEFKLRISDYNRRIEKLDFSDIKLRDSSFSVINNLESINSNNDDFGAFEYNEQLFFFTGNTSNDTLQLINAETSNNILINPGPIGSGVLVNNDKFYFTTKGKIDNSESQVYFTDAKTLIGEETVSRALDFRQKNLDIEHVAVNSNETLIIFSAKPTDRSDGYDLYLTEFNGKKWSRPDLLDLNTESNERYPLIFADSILYFSSDRPGGPGGYDIYFTQLKSLSSGVSLIDAPLNTSADELTFTLNPTGNEGYITSNRQGTIGNYDVIKFYNYQLQIIESDSSESKKSMRGFTAQTTTSEKVKLFEDEEYFFFHFTPGVDYNFITEHDSYLEGKTISSNQTNLAHENIYTFHIKNSNGLYQNSGPGIPDAEDNIESLHMKPGDLISFQLIPLISSVENPGKTTIQVYNQSTNINLRDTILFSYIVEADPDKVIAGSNPFDLSGLSDKSITDDVDSTVVTKEVFEKLIADSESRKQNDDPIESDLQLLDNLIQQGMQKNRVEEIVSQNEDSIAETSVVLSDEMVELANQNSPSAQQSETLDSEEIVDNYDSLSTLASNEPKVDSAILNDTEELLISDEYLLNESPDSMILKDEEPFIAQLEESQIKTEESDEIIDSLLIEPVVSNEETPPEEDTIASTTQTIISGIEEPNSIFSVDLPIVAESDSPEILEPQEEIIQISSRIEFDSTSVVNMPDEQPDKETKEEYLAENDKSEFTEPQNELVEKEVSESINSKAEMISPILFRVQIAASKVRMNEAQQRQIYKGPKEVDFVETGGYFKYHIEETSDYALAKVSLKESGVAGAFISAYENEKRIPLKQAINKQKEFETRIITQKEASPAVLESKIKTSFIDENNKEKVANVEPTKSDDVVVLEVSQPEKTTEDITQPIEKYEPAKETVSLPDIANTDSLKTNEFDSSEYAIEESFNIDTTKVNVDSIVEHVDSQTSVYEVLVDSGQMEQNELTEIIDEEANEEIVAEKTIESTFQFRVQIAASRVKLTDAQIERIYSGTRVVKSFEEDNYFKYYIAEVPTFNEAKPILLQSGVKGAFISVYKDGQKWNLREAIQAQKEK